MKLSYKRQRELYNAIAEQIMNVRIQAARTENLLSHKEVDEWLFRLEQDIWKSVKTALDLT